MLSKHNPRSAHPQNTDPGVKVLEGARAMDPRDHGPKHQIRLLLGTIHWQRGFSTRGVWRSLTGRSGRGKKADAVTAAAFATQLTHCHWKQRSFFQELVLVQV